VAPNEKTHDRTRGQSVKECQKKLQFFYYGKVSDGKREVFCRHYSKFPFNSRQGMARALGLKPGQLKIPKDGEERLSSRVVGKLEKYFGFNRAWRQWSAGSAVEFGDYYNDNSTYEESAKVLGGNVTSFDEVLAGLSLWLGQDVTPSSNGPEWPVSFEFRSQPSPGMVQGIELALRRVHIFVFVDADVAKAVLWRENYPTNYEPEGNNVILRAYGKSSGRGRIAVAKPGCYIECVQPPYDFYRVSGLHEGSVIKAYAAAFSKDLDDAAPEDEKLPAAKRGSRKKTYSFFHVDDGKPVGLLSAEQTRLLKRLAEKEREHNMNPRRPSGEPGWIVLDWAERALTSASQSERE
jgi:hypothetical protein